MTPEEIQALLANKTMAPKSDVPAWAVMMNDMAAGRQTQPAPSPAATQQPMPMQSYSSTGPALLSDQMSDKLFQRINAKGLESRQAQEKGLAGIEDYIQQYKNAPVEGGLKAIDLTPIAALVDSWTGSNLAPAARSIKKPETAEEKKLKLLGLEQLAQKQRENITDKDLELYKLQQQNQLAKETLQYGRDKETKLKELSQATIKQVDEGNAIPGMLANLDSVIDTNKDLFGPVAGTAASKNPYNEKAQTIQAEMKAKSHAFGKFMEGGVLRKEDELKYREMFPNLSDTPEVAKAKLRIVDDLLRRKQQSLIDSYAAQGFGMQGLNLPAAANAGLMTPQVGEVVRGYKYKGGDPKLPASWEKQ